MLKKTLILSTAVSALLSLPVGAMAADATFDVADRIDTHDWSGPYMGISFGLGGQNSDGDHQFTTSSRIDLGALDIVGFITGAHLGWNYVDDQTLIGFEADYSLYNHSDQAFEAEGDASFTYDADYFATVRGRLGIIDGDVLLYATAGIAFTGGDIQTTSTGGEQDRVDFAGPVFGTGLEWAMSHNVTLRSEWLYAKFRNEENLDDFADGQTEDAFLPEDIIAIRAGLTWNYDGTPSFEIQKDEQIHDWNGLVAGGFVGAGMMDSSGVFDSGDSSSVVDFGGITDAGLLAGATIGWNYQDGHLVAGLQADISFIEWDGLAREANSRVDRVELETDYLATVRGRLGYADDDLLVYGTAGIAFISGELNDPTGGSMGQDVGFDETGLVVGAGMEWAVNDQASVFVEGLYLNFDDTTNLSNVGGGDAGDGFTLEDGILAKIGVNFKLN